MGFLTSDLITYAFFYKRRVAEALRDECALNVLEYRTLAYLHDHPDGATATQLSRILDAGTASITLCTKGLSRKHLVKRANTTNRRLPLRITRQGVEVSRDADLVIAQTYERYFACLTPDLKAMVSIGATLANQGTAEGSRMRDGHYFAAFETLHAFLYIERKLTEATRACGLELSDFRVLFEIGERMSGASLRSLAHTLLLAASTITHGIDKLESRRLVVRMASPDDCRAKSVVLTEAGAELLAEASGRVESFLAYGVRPTTAAEQAAYKDAALIVASTLRKDMGR